LLCGFVQFLHYVCLCLLLGVQLGVVLGFGIAFAFSAFFIDQ
jgi:hypothetical protein